MYFCLFPGDRPSYAEIAEWRKILGRLASFLRSIDYLILEMLRRLVVTATRHLLEHLVSAYNVTEEEEEKVCFLQLQCYNFKLFNTKESSSEFDTNKSWVFHCDPMTLTYFSHSSNFDACPSSINS